MQITETQNIEAQMVEVDKETRYLRIRTPSVAHRVWFQPTLGGDEAFRFVLVDEQLSYALEALYMERSQ